MREKNHIFTFDYETNHDFRSLWFLTMLARSLSLASQEFLFTVRLYFFSFWLMTVYVISFEVKLDNWCHSVIHWFIYSSISCFLNAYVNFITVFMLSHSLLLWHLQLSPYGNPRISTINKKTVAKKITFIFV